MTARRWFWWFVVMVGIVAVAYLSQTRPLYRGIYLLEVEPTADQTQ